MTKYVDICNTLGISTNRGYYSRNNRIPNELMPKCKEYATVVKEVNEVKTLLDTRYKILRIISTCCSSGYEQDVADILNFLCDKSQGVKDGN